MKILKTALIAVALLSSTYANAGVDKQQANQLLKILAGGVVLDDGYANIKATPDPNEPCNKCGRYEFDGDVDYGNRDVGVTAKYNLDTEVLRIQGTVFDQERNKYPEISATLKLVDILDPQKDDPKNRGFLAMLAFEGKFSIGDKTFNGEDFIVGLKYLDNGILDYSMIVRGDLDSANGDTKFQFHAQARNNASSSSSSSSSSSGSVSEPAAGLAFLGTLGLLAFGARRRALKS